MWDLEFFKSGEWQVIEEKLDELDRVGTGYCPIRNVLFRALELVPLATCKVAIIGQDPYPNPKYATGVAFDIPTECTTFPPTLGNILKEYQSDLGFPLPRTVSLADKWCPQGVLLWNAIPTCAKYLPSSHRWPEWELLTKEIVDKLSLQGAVFVFLGAIARRNSKYVNPLVDNYIIELPHPSPMGVLNATKSSFFGSRLFTTINTHLHSLGQSPINWRLDDEVERNSRPGSASRGDRKDRKEPRKEAKKVLAPTE